MGLGHTQAELAGYAHCAQHPRCNGVRHGYIERCAAVGTGLKLLPDPRLGEVLPHAFDLNEALAVGFRSLGSRGQGPRVFHRLFNHDTIATHPSEQALPEPLSILRFILLTFRDVVIAEYDDAGIVEDVRGAFGLDDGIDTYVVKLSLRLHVKSLKLRKHLLQIEAVLGENEHGLVDGGESDPCAAFGLYLDSNLFAGFGLVLAERDPDVVGVDTLDIERDVIGCHLTVRKDLVNEQSRGRRHGGRRLE